MSPSTRDVELVILIIIILALCLLIHLVYGCRPRCTKLSQASTSKRSAMSAPLLSSTTSAASKSSIQILSQNVWCVFGNGGANRKQRLQLLLDRIKRDEPDIICLQEMHILGLGLCMLCGDYLFVRTHLVKQGYVYHTDPKPSTPFIGSSSGCVVFSKYPLLSSSCNVFEHRRTARCKGWVYAHISVPGVHELKIINTHLDHKDVNLQYQQMNEIVHAIESNVMTKKDQSSGKVSVLCMGDFNVCSNYSHGGNAYDVLCEYMKTVGLSIDLYSDTARTYSKCVVRKGTQSLDHLFINAECKQYVRKCQVVDYRDEQRIMSDHLGLLTTFQF